jgi:hypothetical protein
MQYLVLRVDAAPYGGWHLIVWDFEVSKVEYVVVAKSLTGAGRVARCRRVSSYQCQTAAARADASSQPMPSAISVT